MLADQTGETLTETVVKALRERFDRTANLTPGRKIAAELEAVADRIAALSALDTRTDDEILGYNQDGVFDHGDGH